VAAGGGGGQGSAGGARRGSLRAAVTAAAIGALATATLVLLTRSAHRENEDRLLTQQVREAATVVRTAIPGLQTPLASAAELAQATEGRDVENFRRLLEPALTGGRPYVAAALWRVGDPVPLTVLGDRLALLDEAPEEILAFLDRAAAAPGLAVLDLLDPAAPRLGYGYTTTLQPVRFVAYAEAAVNREPQAAVEEGGAFSGTHNAIYLGTAERPEAVLTSTTADLPLSGRRATEVVEFGDEQLLIVMTPSSSLGGSLMARMPWLVALVGLVCTAVAAFVAERLVRRRHRAEQLAEENAELYSRQRDVAQTLQRSLLPPQPRSTDELVVSARYEPGDEDVDIGGDWYDVVELSAGRTLFVVGDVSGRGLPAATTMASLRYSIRAFASEGHDAPTIVAKLGQLTDIVRDGHFATILFVTLDAERGIVEMTSAGHPAPLAADADGCRFLPVEVALPVGIRRDVRPRTSVAELTPGSTVLLFTDGLFERRGESLDDGLERLRATVAAIPPDRGLDDVVATTIHAQRTESAHDDTAILGFRWRPTQQVTGRARTTSLTSASS